MTEFRPMTGMPCDATHPYPTPTRSDWVDSMEYGDTNRLPGNGMWDRDTSPIWRAIAASMWRQPCYDQHLAEVAADPILTTRAIAATVLAADPSGRHFFDRSPFYRDDSNAVFEALRTGGQQAARRVVDGLTLDQRTSILTECITNINRAFTALRLDVGGHLSR